MTETWIVLVEAARNTSQGAIDRADLGELLGALDGGTTGGALHSPDRYTLQLTTTGSDPAEALFRVLAMWGDAVRKLELPCCEVVRTEVLRPTELKRDLQTIDGAGWESPHAGAR